MPVPSPIKLLREFFSKKRMLTKKSTSCFDISEPINVKHQLHIDIAIADEIMSTFESEKPQLKDKQAFLQTFNKKQSFQKTNKLD